MKYKFFYKVSVFMRKKNLANYPLYIRRIKISDEYDGLCELKNNKFYIKINKNLNEMHAVDVLIHEIAHAVAWDKDKDFHGTNWGKAYSKIYRIYLKEFLE